MHSLEDRTQVLKIPVGSSQTVMPENTIQDRTHSTYKDFVLSSKLEKFLFVYYMDDPIRKDHDRELFDHLSLRKRRNRINFDNKK